MPVALLVVALIIASMLALARPSQALGSCMSKSEARQHYGAVHIYWHGPDHCWDANPGRPRRAVENQSHINRGLQRGRSRSDWRQAMSEMLPGDAPVQAPDAREAGGDASANWLHRWIDIEQVMPRLAAERLSGSGMAPPVLAPESESVKIPHIVVILVFFTFLLIFATVEILFRNNEQQK